LRWPNNRSTHNVNVLRVQEGQQAKKETRGAARTLITAEGKSTKLAVKAGSSWSMQALYAESADYVCVRFSALRQRCSVALDFDWYSCKRAPAMKRDNIQGLLDQREVWGSTHKQQRLLRGHRSLQEGLRVTNVLHEHAGCVNCLEWHASGQELLSSGDDQKVSIGRLALGTCRTTLGARSSFPLCPRFFSGAAAPSVFSGGTGWTRAAPLDRVLQSGVRS
jgi:hypothetical protein